MIPHANDTTKLMRRAHLLHMTGDKYPQSKNISSPITNLTSKLCSMVCDAFSSRLISPTRQEPGMEGTSSQEKAKTHYLNVVGSFKHQGGRRDDFQNLHSLRFASRPPVQRHVCQPLYRNAIANRYSPSSHSSKS